MKTQLEKDLNSLKQQFNQRIDFYIATMDDNLSSSVKLLDDRTKQLRKINDELNKYRLDLMVYQQTMQKEIDKQYDPKKAIEPKSGRGTPSGQRPVSAASERLQIEKNAF